MKYFANIHTVEELKNKYRELCLTLHPDRGGNAEDFAEMMKEYEQAARDLNGTNTNHTTNDDAAQDFADMMGTPLKGTKGKTFGDLVAEIADIMADDNRRAAYQRAGEVWGCYGWDGCAMTPESRAAYINKFGRVLVEMAELAATLKAAADKKAYEQTHYAAHVIEARRNQATGCKAPKIGAFVFGVGCNWKSDGRRGVFVNFDAFAADPEEFGEKYDDPERRHLCKVVEVIEVSADDFSRPGLADELVERANAEGRDFAGGLATDDPEPEYNPQKPWSKYTYYYTECAAVVCRESGRWYLINCEGYNYARYCYMSTNWRTMFAPEIAAAERKEAEKQEKARQEKERETAERLAAYRAKCAKYDAAGLEDLTTYREALKAANAAESDAARAHGWRSQERKAAAKKAQAAAAALMAAEKRNIKAMAAHAFPGLKCKVTKAKSWRGRGYELTYEDGPTLETFTNNTDFDLFSSYWEEYRVDDCTEIHRHDFTEFSDKYGDGHGVEITREMSKAERERLTAAILQAVPAAAGICWENRHEWTQDEIKAAAAACGVDGGDLWHEYDRKHSYWNFVTAEGLAEWAHEMIAYDLAGNADKATENAHTGKKASKADTNTANADESAQSAQDTANTPNADEAPADELQLVEIPGGVAVVGDSRATYKNRKAIKAHGARWNRDAQQWQATDPDGVATLRAWFGMSDNATDDSATGEATTTAANGPQSTKADEADDNTTTNAESAQGAQDAPESGNAADIPAADVAALAGAFADIFRAVANAMQEAKKYEGVTIPAETLERWRTETMTGAKCAAAQLSEVCACLGCLTPESRKEFDALGVIFWTLADQLQRGFNPDTIAPATDYARGQLFDLIDRTQTPNQAAAVREATDQKEAA